MSKRDTRNLLFLAELVENGKLLSRNIFFFRPYKELNIPHPAVEHQL
jgi:beta-mannosidase